jgi:hypothetical protein
LKRVRRAIAGTAVAHPTLTARPMRASVDPDAFVDMTKVPATASA